MRKSAAAIAASEEPAVFTKYSVPTERPTTPDSRTAKETSSGSVAPMRSVGASTRAKDKPPVAAPDQVAV
jgi:hypothetical protein